MPAGYDPSEAQFQATVIELARIRGWRVYHTHDSRRSAAGFPDLVLVHAHHGVLYRELKTNTGNITPDQAEWLAALAIAGADAKTWRPMDIERVERELHPEAAA